MQPLIATHLDQIRALCRRHGVRSLFLFGSAAREDFDATRSDVDFLVDFGTADLGPWMRGFFLFRAELAAILGRPVDLVPAVKSTNPYLASSIDVSKVQVYAAA